MLMKQRVPQFTQEQRSFFSILFEDATFDNVIKLFDYIHLWVLVTAVKMLFQRHLKIWKESKRFVATANHKCMETESDLSLKSHPLWVTLQTPRLYLKVPWINFSWNYWSQSRLSSVWISKYINTKYKEFIRNFK